MGETLVKKRKLHFPHVMSLVFILIIVVAIATWIIPSGSFARQEVETSIGTRVVAVAGSYEEVPKGTEDGDLRQGIGAILMAPVRGMQEAAQVVCFVLIVGGAFGILDASGAIIAGLTALIRKLGKRDYLLIPIVLILFSIAGSTNGMGEEAIPFFAIFVPLCLRMGYDSFTAFFIVFLMPRRLHCRHHQSLQRYCGAGDCRDRGKSSALVPPDYLGHLHSSDDYLADAVRCPG